MTGRLGRTPRGPQAVGRHRRAARSGRAGRAGRALAVTVGIAVLAACTSGSSPAKSSPTPSRPPGPLPTTAAALPATPPTTTGTLAALLARGAAVTGYAAIDFSTALSDNSLAGAGRVAFYSGTVTQLDVRAKVSQIGTVHYLVAGGTPYAALPKPTKPGKPYVVLGKSSSDQLDRAAIGLQATKLVASPSTYRTLVAAASSLKLIGRESVGPVAALHYRAPVSVAKITSSDPVATQVRLALTTLKVPSLLLDLWVDGAGRVLKASAPAPDGRKSEVTFSGINQQFSVAKPPAAQVDG